MATAAQHSRPQTGQSNFLDAVVIIVLDVGLNHAARNLSNIAIARVEAVAPLREVFQADGRAAGDGRQRIVGDADGNAQLFVHELVESAQLRPAAGEHQTVVGEIGDELGLALLDDAL